MTATIQTVFITTSGLGTRLEGLTQFTNKALVKIGDRYAICRIIDRFDESVEFVITLGYYGSHVRDFLELAYPTRRFTFVEVNPYAGPGSSQAYSMLAAEPYLQKPFLYHCCDTILPADQQLSPPNQDTLFVSPHADYISYSGITVDPNTPAQIRSVNKKKEVIHDFVYIGISYIHEYRRFWSALRACVDAEPENASIGDTTAYTRILASGGTIAYDVLPVFYDTGNLDSYRHACKQFPSQHVVLDKPNESLCFLQDSVIKFVHSTETNARRLLRVESLESIVPKMLGCRPNFLKMELIKGTVLAECEEWGIVQRLLTWAESSLWTVEKQDPAFYDTCIAFYRDKTRQRIAEYLKRSAKESNTVNGVPVGSIDSLLARVPFNELAVKATLHRYHGDFILDNIMQREDGSFVLLDWRESFGDQIQWGDRAYDLAKLRHNIVFNHTNIQKGLFSIYGGPDSSIYVDLKCNYFLMRQLEDVDAFIESRGWNVGNIRILQALIWLNMAPLYEAPLSDFLFYFGKFNLWLALR